MKIPVARESSGRIKLLDAAEELFARYGYDGASLRSITRLAGVELGLSGYHFRNKDELFRQVLLRRAPDMVEALDRALDAALQAGQASPRASVRAILHAYVEPHVEWLHGTADGRRNYVRLAAVSSLVLDRPELTAEPVKIYAPVIDRFRDALGAVLDDANPLALDRYYAIFRNAILSISVNQPRAFGSSELGETTSGNPGDVLIESLVDVFTAGFLDLQKRACASLT